MYDSIIFDLDGTLWDAVDNILISWNKVLENNNKLKITKPQLSACMGLKMDLIAEKLFPDLDRKSQIALMEKCSDYELKYLAEHRARLYDGIEETINTLSKTHKLFICSNCQKGYIECFLGCYKLGQYFTDTECWGNTGLSKGENISLLIKRNNLKSPVYVGDTQGDKDAAYEAEIPFVFAAYGFGKTDEYDYKVHSIKELPHVIIN